MSNDNKLPSPIKFSKHLNGKLTLIWSGLNLSMRGHEDCVEHIKPFLIT